MQLTPHGAELKDTDKSTAVAGFKSCRDLAEIQPELEQLSTASVFLKMTLYADSEPADSSARNSD